MEQEAGERKLSADERVGAIVLDEMAIQQDLTLIHKGLETCYAGQVEVTDYPQDLINQRKGNISVFAYFWTLLYIK